MAEDAISILRIYLRRPTTARRGGVWRRIFGRPLARTLASEALELGIRYATVSVGTWVGGTVGDRWTMEQPSEIISGIVPTCLELVGTKEELAQFVEFHRSELVDAVLVRLDGVAIDDLS